MKVLLISHNPICTYNAMGKTFASLFSQFDRMEFCQLYIYPSFPDMNCCSSYYRMTDKEVLRSLFTREQPGGPVPEKAIHSGQFNFEKERDKKLYRRPQNKKPLYRLGRDCIWMLSPWNSNKLRSWLDEEAPDKIMVAPGAAKFLYDIALNIAQDRGIPIAVYICDEYYFAAPAQTPGGRLQQTLLQRKTEKLLARASLLVVISEELKKAYSEQFPIPTHVIMTGSTITANLCRGADQYGERLCFFGNIRSNRFLSLAEIGKCLDQINLEHNSHYSLIIYTAEHDRKILTSFDGIESVQLHTFVSGPELSEAMRCCGLLLHVESFDPQNREKVKNSISTKIADSLASGVPLFAYGPESIASIEHLRRNACAFVCTDRSRLKESLWLALSDSHARNCISETALSVAEKMHDSEKNSRQLYSLMESLQEEKA